jgi:hypothetical protein
MQHEKNIKSSYAERHQSGECIGWLDCAQPKIYKHCKIWELKRNSILYRGIVKSSPQNKRYFKDDKYIPGQYKHMGSSDEFKQPIDKVRDFIYLTGKLESAAIYTMGVDARIITFKTISRLRLLNMNDHDTLKYLYTYCDSLNTDVAKNLKYALADAFGISNKNGILNINGRYSSSENDYKMLSLLQQVFIWVDGYAAEPIYSGGSWFHEELAVLQPSLKLIRHNIEYRPTNIVYYPTEWDRFPRNIHEMWYEICNGKLRNKILIESAGLYSMDPYKRYSYMPTSDKRDRFIFDAETYIIPAEFIIGNTKYTRGKFIKRKLIYYNRPP